MKDCAGSLGGLTSGVAASVPQKTFSLPIVGWDDSNNRKSQNAQ